MKGETKMSDKKIWTIEPLNDDRTIGVFSTKGKAIDAIIAWSKGIHTYDIVTNIKKIKRSDGTAEIINIRYHENERLVPLYVRSLHLNNGAGMCVVFRHHFGNTDENQD
jgi:hypothetical protein